MSSKGVYFYGVKILLSFVLIVAILSSLAFVAYQLILPDADEYDNPETPVQESFPWNPNIFTNGSDVVYLLSMGILRHVSILPQHITSSTLIVMVGYIFVTMFIYRVRKTFLQLERERRELGIHHYVEWAIGSIIGAIISLAGIVRLDIGNITSGILWLSISVLIVYIIHPRLGLLFAIKSRIHPRTPCPLCNTQIPPDSKYCPNCGRKLKDKD